MNDVALYTLNVGHGLCQVLVFPGRRAIVVDGGSYRNTHVPADFLGKHVDVILAYIATHNDEDHVGAAVHFLMKFGSPDTLHEIWMLVDRPGDAALPLYDYAKARFRERSIKDFVYANLGDERKKEPRLVYMDEATGCQVDLLYPGMMHNIDAFRRAQPSGQAQNRTSVVLRITRGNATALITGDADLESMRVINKDYGFSVKAQVVFVPHHGGRLPSVKHGWSMNDLCRATQPDYAIVSSGTNSTTVRPDSIGPFAHAGAQVCCTQITAACHPDPSSFGHGVMASPIVRVQGKATSGVECCGEICAMLKHDGAAILKAAAHRNAVKTHVRPRGTPLCLKDPTANTI